MAELTSSIFADYNATTPLCPPVVAAFNAWQDVVGNMSSSHYFGQQVHGRYDDAQYRIKSLLNAHHFELFTCSSATEANHWFIYSILEGIEGCPRVIASQIEHPCVMAPLQHYATEGCIDLQLCRVDRHGQLDMAHFDELLTSNTVLVSVMLANNEIGSIQPLQEIATKASHVGALVHSDIVQAAGKIPIDLANMPVDAVSLSSHKCYAPTGCGVLMVKSAELLRPWLLGGSQQQKLRAGTVHVMGLDLFAAGLQYCYDALPTCLDVHAWANALCQASANVNLAIPLNDQVLWNTVPLVVAGQLSHDAMMRLDVMGVGVGTGSACSTGAVDVSPVIQAIGVKASEQASVIRLSFGYPTTMAELRQVAEYLKA